MRQNTAAARKQSFADLSPTLIRRIRQYTLRSWSSIGAPSLSSLSLALSDTHTHTHTPPGSSSVCVFAGSFSRQFTSINMCGNPRAHVLRAFHWLTSRRRSLPLADPASQWLPYSPLIGRRPGHSRSCPLMCRSCVWCRGRGCSTTASGCKHTHACTYHGAGPRDAQYVLCII